ncbi:MAG: outer membrane protein assembly factor BamD, partial [Deltaproteobacteria bacterium]
MSDTQSRRDGSSVRANKAFMIAPLKKHGIGGSLSWFWLPTLLLLLLITAAAPSVCQSRERGGSVAAEKLWNRAMDLKGTGDWERAANAFLRVYQEYPASPMAEDSLLQAIQYYREAADFDRSRLDTLVELCKRYIVDFPKSKNVENIHFELGRFYY